MHMFSLQENWVYVSVMNITFVVASPELTGLFVFVLLKRTPRPRFDLLQNKKRLEKINWS